VVSNTIVGRACDLLPWARELATQGYRVMLFDYSALRPTTDNPAAVDLFAKDTVEAAAKLRELGVQKVVLISGSDEVTESVRRLEIPVLFVAANDDFRTFQMANELHGTATSAKSRKLVLLDGALHADQLLKPTAPTKRG
jgi:pimeloyl-ACP methyl ester carboxylesterase